MSFPRRRWDSKRAARRPGQPVLDRSVPTSVDRADGDLLTSGRTSGPGAESYAYRPHLRLSGARVAGNREGHALRWDRTVYDLALGMSEERSRRWGRERAELGAGARRDRSRQGSVWKPIRFLGRALVDSVSLTRWHSLCGFVGAYTSLPPCAPRPRLIHPSLSSPPRGETTSAPADLRRLSELYTVSLRALH